jgi:hypothetical protein
MGAEPVYGMLTTKWVELPYDTIEEQAEADKTNRELAGIGRVFRGAVDWAFKKYNDSRSLNPGSAQRPEATPLESGDLVKIFKTVSDGDVLWQGTVDYDFKKYHHGLQKGLSPQAWASMFSDTLPARLERDGKAIFGALELYDESGSEGVIWSLQEYGKPGYAGLVFLKDGDRLTVYDNVRNGEVEWEGRLEFGPENVAKIGWTEIMREARHMDTQEWLQMSWQNRPGFFKTGTP